MSQIHSENGSANGAERHSPYVLEQIRSALNGLRFGTVTVIVQDGVVVQVDRTERLRLPRGERSS